MKESESFANSDAVVGIDGGGLHRLLVESVRDYAIFALDRNGNVASWNPGAQRIKGYSAEEIIGRHFSTFYPQAEIDAGKPAWELEVAIREGRFEEEGTRLRKSGAPFWANVVITPLRSDRGEVVGFAKVTRDLTERRAAQERALEDARRVAAAESANKTKSEFLASMSHELRTPLNAIGGYAELMEHGVAGAVTEQQRSYLARIRRNQHHLLSLINEILNFAKVEAGRVQFDLEQVQVNDVLAQLESLIAPQLIEKKLHYEFSGCPAGSVAHVDRDRLQQIMLNLLSNAVKFTPPEGRVALECESASDVLRVRVRDSGVGIPTDKHEAIFEPFVQLERTLVSPHEGTGLGLAISRDLARAMGGELIVETSGPGGTTFMLTLPRVTATA